MSEAQTSFSPRLISLGLIVLIEAFLISAFATGIGRGSGGQYVYVAFFCAEAVTLLAIVGAVQGKRIGPFVLITLYVLRIAVIVLVGVQMKSISQSYASLLFNIVGLLTSVFIAKGGSLHRARPQLRV